MARNTLKSGAGRLRPGVSLALAATTKKGNGFAAAAQAGLNHLIEDGSYAKILDRWGLSSEAVQKSELNPAGLPKK